MAALVAAMLAAGCSTTGPGYSADEPSPGSLHDNAKPVSAGVLRVDSARGKHLAFLTVSRMTALDAVDIALPQCAVAAVGRHPRFIDVNWRAVRDSLSLPVTHLTVSTPEGDVLTQVDPDGGCQRMRGYPLEALGAGDGEQLVLQLVAPASDRPLRGLRVGIAGTTVRLPLVRDCGGREQPKTLTCTDGQEPVTYAPGSPFSVSVREAG